MSASPSNRPSKPLIFADNPFDDTRTDALENSDDRWDRSYVPKYSEARRENEIREAKGQERVKMPKLYWARVSGTGGGYLDETDEGMMQTLQLGYRACGTDDLEENGWEMPPTASVSEDGLIRRGDQALFIVGAERAERNRERKKARGRRGLSNRVGSTGEVYRSSEEENFDRKASLDEISEMEPNL